MLNNKLDTENSYESWNNKTNCEHNQWDIGINVPICTHEFIPQLAVCVCFSPVDNKHIPHFCPLKAKESGIRNNVEYKTWLFNQVKQDFF